MDVPLLTQYRLTLVPRTACQPRPEWGYPLYAALLEQVAPDFGEALHRDGVTPLSQYLVPTENPDGELLWSVTLLGPESQAYLGKQLETQRAIFLRKYQAELAIVEREICPVPDVETLLEQGGRCGPYHELQFRTATAFKSQGAYQILPSSRLILQNLIRKWNGCFPDCPIEDSDGQGLDTLAAGLHWKAFTLSDRRYCLKKAEIPGFIGRLTLQNRLRDAFHRRLAGTLLCFANYAGIGIKTTLGMGGVEQRSFDRPRV